MTSWIIAHSAPLVSTAALLMVIYVMLSRDGAAHRERMQRLTASHQLVDKHMLVLDRLVGDDRISDSLKSKLLSFGATMANDESFLKLWQKAFDMVSQPGKELSAFDRELAQLYSVDPELGCV